MRDREGIIDTPNNPIAAHMHTLIHCSYCTLIHTLLYTHILFLLYYTSLTVHSYTALSVHLLYTHILTVITVLSTHILFLLYTYTHLKYECNSDLVFDLKWLKSMLSCTLVYISICRYIYIYTRARLSLQHGNGKLLQKPLRFQRRSTRLTGCKNLLDFSVGPLDSQQSLHFSTSLGQGCLWKRHHVFLCWICEVTNN